MDVRAPRGWRLALFTLFVVGIGLVHGIHATYMHPDEFLVYRFTRKDLAFTVTYLAQQDTHPPLWFSFFWLWRQLVGSSEFVGRVQAVFFSLIGLAVVYQTGKQWFGAARFGLFALVALAVSALFFQYGLEIRPYGLVILLASSSMLAFQRWLTRRTWRAAALYAATLALMLYVHYFLVLMILGQAVWFVLGQRLNGRLMLQAVGVALLALVLWLPWLPSFVNQVGNLRSAEITGGNVRGALGAGTTTEETSIEAVTRLIERATNGQPALYALVLAAGVALLWRRTYRLALLWALGVPAIAFLVNTVFAVYAPRYILSFIIGLALAVGAGLAALPGRWRWPALAGFTAVALWAMPSQLPADRIPYRALVHELAAAIQPGDVILFDQANEEGSIFLYEYERQLPVELRASATGDPEQALAARRVWFITADWFNDEVQASFHRLEQTHPVQQVVGKCDRGWCFLIQLMQGAPSAESVWFGERLAFRGADLDSVLPGQVQTRLWWQVEAPLPMDYSIGLQLLDESGALIAQHDGSINDQYSGVVGTSQLQPGRLYIDRRNLSLPAGIRSGDYTLVIVVYDWQTGERLRLDDGADSLRIAALALP